MIVDRPVGGETMLGKITREVLEGYLDCKYKAYLKLTGEQGTISEYEQLTKEITILIHETATDKLNARHRKAETKAINLLDRAILKQGLPLLLGPIFQNAKMSICFDALQKGSGSSSLGDFYYIPVLFHEVERPSQKQRSILEIQSLILAGLQRREPAFGILFHGIGCQVKRVRMKMNDGKSQLMFKEIMEMQAGKQPKSRLNDHCRICEFYQRCYADAKAKDDLSLLHRMSEKEISKYNKRGIFTVTQLSCTFRARRSRRNSSQKPQPYQHALKALAIREQKVYVYGTPELPVCDTRIYFDVEGDEDRRFSYLVGMIVQTEGKEENHSFWADTLTDERRVYEQFVNVVRHYENFRLFAYGSYEALFLRRMLKHTDMGDITKRLLGQLVNILSLISTFVYFPVYTNSLKDIARYLGFNWTEPQASGLLSIAWCRKWETTGWSAFKEKLLNYNLEDCSALTLVANFISMICANRFSDGNPDSQNERICRVQDIDFPWRKPQWGPASFVIPEYEIINSCAYFDYQRAKVYVRTNQAARRNIARKRRYKKRKKTLRPAQLVRISAQECPLCGGSNLSTTQDRRLSRISYDLAIGQIGIKRKALHAETA
jgi:predicted RecB family nuclease